jgi:hypothetical protein
MLPLVEASMAKRKADPPKTTKGEALTFVENLAAFRRPSEKVVYRFVLSPWGSQP